MVHRQKLHVSWFIQRMSQLSRCKMTLIWNDLKLYRFGPRKKFGIHSIHTAAQAVYIYELYIYTVYVAEIGNIWKDSGRCDPCVLRTTSSFVVLFFWITFWSQSCSFFALKFTPRWQNSITICSWTPWSLRWVRCPIWNLLGNQAFFLASRPLSLLIIMIPNDLRSFHRGWVCVCV